MNAIPRVLTELAGYYADGTVGPELSAASFGPQNELDRVVCIKLLSWWSRRLLLRSSWPYLDLLSTYPWCQRLIALVAASPAFREVMSINGDRCTFAPQLTRDDWKLINEFARLRYQPKLMTKTA